MRLLLLSSLIFYGLLTQAKGVSPYEVLRDIKYTIVYPAHLPKDYKVASVTADHDKTQPYLDYQIKVAGPGSAVCEISSGHEFGDNVLISGTTRKRKVKTSLFGEIDVWFLTAKEIEAELQKPVRDGRVETQWINLLPEKKMKKDVGSYSFSCSGVSDDIAIQILTGLDRLKR